MLPTRAAAARIIRSRLRLRIKSDLQGWFGVARGSCPTGQAAYSAFVEANPTTLSVAELRTRLRPLCEKHRIRRLEVFGSAARGKATAESDVDLLATFVEGT